MSAARAAKQSPDRGVAIPLTRSPAPLRACQARPLADAQNKHVKARDESNRPDDHYLDYCDAEPALLLHHRRWPGNRDGSRWPYIGLCDSRQLHRLQGDFLSQDNVSGDEPPLWSKAQALYLAAGGIKFRDVQLACIMDEVARAGVAANYFETRRLIELAALLRREPSSQEIESLPLSRITVEISSLE